MNKHGVTDSWGLSTLPEGPEGLAFLPQWADSALSCLYMVPAKILFE